VLPVRKHSVLVNKAAAFSLCWGSHHLAIFGTNRGKISWVNDQRRRNKEYCDEPNNPGHRNFWEATMPKEPKKLDELFHDTLKDIYFAEKKILAALPFAEICRFTTVQ
jgi:hypothetical protein